MSRRAHQLCLLMSSSALIRVVPSGLMKSGLRQSMPRSRIAIVTPLSGESVPGGRLVSPRDLAHFICSQRMGGRAQGQERAEPAEAQPRGSRYSSTWASGCQGAAGASANACNHAASRVGRLSAPRATRPGSALFPRDARQPSVDGADRGLPEYDHPPQQPWRGLRRADSSTASPPRCDWSAGGQADVLSAAARRLRGRHSSTTALGRSRCGAQCSQVPVPVPTGKVIAAYQTGI